MNELKLDLTNLHEVFENLFSPEQVAQAQTVFLKRLAVEMHKLYQGKMMTVPKAGIYGFNWFNVWYTPGVSAVSTSIRDDHELSFSLSNRSNLVAVVSDSTRVLGDGDCSPSGGMGVMEGKAMLMKYLGGIDAIALCVNNRNADGKPQADKIIDFVQMLEPSVGAVNLEDISQPNCYRVLEELQNTCNIPVWHDDAQGTACVTLAGLINSLKLVNKELEQIKIVLFGAGASNSTIARFLLLSGVNPNNMIIFDSRCGIHKNRHDLQSNPDKYVQWMLAQQTNPNCIESLNQALNKADVLIALSTPGPNTIDPRLINLMNDKPIVFACANPVPEIYPYDAIKNGAYIVATGRGDFPNQINNSLGFPGILKGALIARARKITDNMAICAAKSLANYAEKRGIEPNNIIPKMDEADVFPEEAADVATQAIKDKVARLTISREQALERSRHDIQEARRITNLMMDKEIITKPDYSIIQKAIDWTVKSLRDK